MIGRLHGILVEQTPDGSCIIDVQGVGYECTIPLGTLGRLEVARGKDPKEKITVHIHTHVREDALTLFGFESAEERRVFRTLLGISNVGPKLAIAILSTMNTEEMAEAVAREDRNRFQSVPGVGKRTAERLLLELKDKLNYVTRSNAVVGTMKSGIRPKVQAKADGPLEQVNEMLIAMGFRNQEAQLAIEKIASEAEGKTANALLREALGQLG